MGELEHYELVRELAAGGMGKVYVARHRELGREVALKVIHGWQVDAETLRRFVLEGETSARLRHPGVVTVHELGTFRGKPCIVMELVDGESLQERLKREGPFPAEEAARITGDIADALVHAHQQGVLHRDLKPANVLIDAEGRALVTDFGLAKDLCETRDRLTVSGQVLGTPAYMPPEQANADRAAMGPPSDVYGLGATLYALLTGQPPFRGASPLNVIAQVLGEAPRPPHELNPEIPSDLEAVCLKCLAKAPADRYPSAVALSEDLRRFLAGEPVLGRPPRRRTRRALFLIPLGLIALAPCAVVLTRPAAPAPLNTPPAKAPPPAKAQAQELELEREARQRKAAMELRQIVRRTPSSRRRYEELAAWLKAHPLHPDVETARTAQLSCCVLRIETKAPNGALLWGEASGSAGPGGLEALVGGRSGLDHFDLGSREKIRTWPVSVWGLVPLGPSGACLTSEQGLLLLERGAAQPEPVTGLSLGSSSPIAVDPSGSRVALGSVSSVLIKPLPAGLGPTFGDPSGSFFGLEFLDEGLLVCLLKDRLPLPRHRLRIQTRDATTGELLEERPVAGADGRDLALSRKRRLIAVGYTAHRGVVEVYDEQLNLLQELGTPQRLGLAGVTNRGTLAVAFSPDGGRVHCIGNQGSEIPEVTTTVLRTWSLDEKRWVDDPVVLATRELSNVGGLAVSADGRWALVLWSDRIEVWPLPD